MRFHLKLFVLIGLFAVVASAQTGILDSKRIGNWKTAGVQGGIPSGSWTQCGPTIAAYGTVGSPASAATISNAVGACAGLNQYVKLAAGDFYIDDSIGNGLCFHGVNGVEIRGTDPGTKIHITNQCNAYYLFADMGFSSSQNCALISGGNGCPNTANVSGTVTQGSTTITLSAVSNLVVGGVINLIRSEDTTDIGSFFEQQLTTGGNPFTAPGNAGPYSWQGENSVEPGYGQSQAVEVTQCDGSSVIGHTCSSGTNITISPGIEPPQLSGGTVKAWWASGSCSNDGINNITIDSTNDGASAGSGSGLTIFNCRSVWATNSAVQEPSRSGFLAQYSMATTFSNNYVWYSRHSIPGGQTSYGFELAGSSDSLIENNICQMIASCIVPQSSTGTVADYNFSIYSLYGASTNYQVSAIEPHNIGDDMQLFEGNILDGSFDADTIHGDANMGTLFRNYFGGVEPLCYVSGTFPSITNGACTSGNIGGIILEAFHRYYNSVANVLGNPTTTGYKNTGVNPAYTTGIANNSSAADAVTTNSAAFWGTYDYKTGAVRWCGNSSDTGWVATCGSTSEIPTGDAFYPLTVPTVGDTGAGQSALPASFIYNSKPSWWPGSKPWPGIGPDVGTGGNTIYCTGGSDARAYMTSSSACTGAGGTAAAIAGGRVYSNPAMDCYFLMGGNPQGFNTTALSFEASSCYTTNGAATPSCAPGSGTYSGTQSVTCSTSSGGAIMCYTTDGSTPATNGAMACNNGTLYSGAISVASSETLKVVAGGTGFSDSSAVAYNYTITGGGGTTPSGLSGGARISNGAIMKFN